MIRTFLEYQIQRALDNSPKLPAWLRAVLRFDPRLRQFADDSRQLDHLLRSGARSRRESLFDTSSQPPQIELAKRAAPASNRALVGWLSAAALAASVAIAVYSQRTIERRANAEHARFLSEKFAAVPEEMAAMLTRAVNNSQLPRYNPLLQLQLPEANLLADLSASTQATLTSQVNSLVSPWESLSTEFLLEWNTPGEPGT